jgi:hypothetical protein
MNWNKPEDDKKYVRESELRALLEKGAVVIELNGEQIGGRYSHVVKHEGITYVHNSDNEINFSGIKLTPAPKSKGPTLELRLVY